MPYVYCFLLGYVMGCISPSYAISLFKKKDLRKQNTGNLGATNTMLTFGWGWGIFVMVFDICKAFAAVKICAVLFSEYLFMGLVGGIASAIGHIFPFYLKFRGGKGLATFGGMVLAYSPLTFLFLFAIGWILILTLNYSVAMPFSASVLFPFFVFYLEQAWQPALFAALFGILIIIKHWPNFRKIRDGSAEKARVFIKKHVIR